MRLAARRQQQQPLDGRLQLHAVVGRLRLAATRHFPLTATLHGHRPRAGAGVAVARRAQVEAGHVSRQVDLRRDAQPRLPRQPVDGLVGRVAAVPAHPVPGDVVLPHQRLQLAPQVDVGNGVPLLVDPAGGAPLGHALGNAAPDVLRIGVELHPARPLQRPQRADGRLKLHAVVGRLGIVASQHTFALSGPQNRRPAANARVRVGAAVAVDNDLVAHKMLSAVLGPIPTANARIQLIKKLV